MKIVRCRILVLAVMLLAVCGEAGAYYLSESQVPDRIFREYLNGFNSVYYGDYNQVTQISVTGKSIYSLKGVELFTNLQTLKCANNRITELDLTSNPYLRILYCHGNLINTLDLSNNIRLEELTCDFTIGSSGEYRTFNFTAFKRAYSLDIELNDNSTVTVTEGSSLTTASYKLSDIKNTSSGQYIMRFPKKYDPFVSLKFQPYGTALASVTIYPASDSSSGNTDSESTDTTTPTAAPTITSTALDTATVGEEYSFQLEASGSSATWSVKGKLPAGLSMSSSGLITGTPTKQGSSKITFIATNDLGEDKKKLTLTVYELPSITTESLKPATVGKKYKETIKGTGSKPLTWEFDADLPDGLTLDTNKHKISGKPTINTSGTVTVTLSNPAGSVTKTFTLSAEAILPEIKTKKLKDGTWNKPYKAVIKAKGTEPITLTLSGDLPEGLTFNADTGEISGTPTEASYDVPITIIASNMGGETYKDYTLTIKAVPPKFTIKKFPDAVKGEAYYSPSIEYTGGPDVDIWLDDENSLYNDCGLFLSWGLLPVFTPIVYRSAQNEPYVQTDVVIFDGYTYPRIEGTPTKAGKFKFTLVAENSAKKVKKTFTINILSAPEFTESSSTLKSGTVGKSYKYKFSADGTKKITFSISSGSLPSGVSLNAKGKLSGKPTSAGVYNFTVKAANSIGEATMDFSITITNKDGSMTSDETSSAAPSDKSALNDNLSVEDETPQIQETDSESESEETFTEGEGYEIVAELPEVSVDVSGMYDLSVELDEKANAGEKLLWLANSGEPSDDDDIAEFSDEDGREIECVPENRKVNVSAWLNAGKTYKPAVAVRR